MATTEGDRPHETFDPGDWEAFRALAHRMLDDTIDHLASVAERPVWQEMPASVRASFDEPLPAEGVGEASAYEAFLERVRPYPSGNIHPRFFGWVMGNGTPLGMMAELLGAALNPHMAGFNQAPALVEHQVIRWLAELMGLPADASGVLVSGGSMANLLGLAVARHARAGFDVRRDGLQGGHAPLLLYGSDETHGWSQKAAELLGLGRGAYRRIPTDASRRIRVDLLRAAIRGDREAGGRPFCVIGTAGTVNTGAADDLRALAALCREEDVWFHVDGAFGALLRASETLRGHVDGIEEADSLAFDLHKWGSLPFECACLLVRDAEAHRAAFATAPAYLSEAGRGVIAGGLPFAERGIDLTRGFKSLKVWLSLRAYGVRKLGRIVDQNVRQAQYLRTVVEEHPELELLAPAPLNIVCFRYRPSGPALDDAALNAINEELLLRIQEAGVAVPSSTELDGRYALRVCLVNHRTRWSDLDLFVEAVLRHGAEVTRA